MLCDLVIQCTPGLIGSLRVPVDAGTPGVASCLVHSLDQTPPDATTSSMLGGKEILQVADIVQSGGTAMKHVVRDANELVGLFRNDRFYWLESVEEPLPRGSSDLFVKCRGTASAVERVIAVPKRSPTVVIAPRDGPYCSTCGDTIDSHGPLQRLSGGTRHRRYTKSAT